MIEEQNCVEKKPDACVVFPEICDPERKRAFAREQVQFLRNHGINEFYRIGRIFKVAGPGQIQEAFKLATCIQDRVLVDVLDCLITGMGGSQEFGWQRMAKVLERCGFYVPQVHSANCFFKVLDGALEILIPGSYEFEAEDDAQFNKHSTSLERKVS